MLDDFMPAIILNINISDTTAAILDALRDTKTTREEVLCHALQIGISDLVEDAARLNRELITATIRGTQYQADARKNLFGVDLKTAPVPLSIKGQV
jgi:hypothetical protein